MKHLVKTTSILVGLLISQFSFAQWVDISPQSNSTDDIIYDVYFSSDDNGIAVGNNPGTYEGLVYTTSDGGQNWTKKTYANTAWRSIHFTDAMNGIISGRVNDGGFTMTTQFLHTNDGGATWTLSSGNDNGITAVSFINDKIGYAIGGGYNVGEAGVQKTTDGGKTWTSMWSYYGWFIGDIHFVDENTGFIAGGSYVGSFDAILAKTTDGGVNFTELNYNKERSATGLVFTSNDVGYVLDRTSTSSRKLSKTTDQGATWTKIADLDKDVHLLRFIDENDAFAAGGNGEVYQSSDAGQTWSASASTNYPKTIRNVKAFGKYIYIMGQDPFVQRMEHGSTPVVYTSTPTVSANASSSTVKVYPNPANNQSSIQFEGLNDDNAEFYLINATGLLVYNGNVENNQIDLSTLELDQGVYFYQVQANDETTSGKLIIE